MKTETCDGCGGAIFDGHTRMSMVRLGDTVGIGRELCQECREAVLSLLLQRSVTADKQRKADFLRKMADEVLR